MKKLFAFVRQWWMWLPIVASAVLGIAMIVGVLAKPVSIPHADGTRFDWAFAHVKIDWFLVAAAILGVTVLVTVQLLAYYRGHKDVSLVLAILVLMAAIALVGAVRVCCLAIAPPPELGDYDRGTIFLGGVAVIWLSVSETIKLIRQP